MVLFGRFEIAGPGRVHQRRAQIPLDVWRPSERGGLLWLPQDYPPVRLCANRSYSCYPLTLLTMYGISHRNPCLAYYMPFME